MPKRLRIRERIVLFAAGLLVAITLYRYQNRAVHFDSHPAQAATNVNATIPEVFRALTQEKTWLNTSRALTAEELSGRITLVDFWTFCCINCMHVLPELHALEKEFGANLTVIGVHSAKFENEKDTANIRSAILRYEIEHPVVNDAEFKIWNQFGVRAWPTLLLIAPDGHIAEAFSGEGHREELRQAIQKLINETPQASRKTSPLPVALERSKTPTSILSFPGKLAFDPIKETLFIADSSHHRILAVNREGKIFDTIGHEGKAGNQDGNFEQALFNRPQGLLFDAGRLYVADTENHLLRQIDFKSRQVSTLAGTGVQGFQRNLDHAAARSVSLSSPWDLALIHEPRHAPELAIAMAGTHQLWAYDLDRKTLRVLAGNGRESIEDGRYPENSLSQPSGLAVWKDKLYFVDSETSSLRVYAQGRVETLVGTGLFDFGWRDGVGKRALLQHPLGVFVDDSGVYIADTYNHSIRRYDPATKRVETLVGRGKKGFKDGSFQEALIYEPGDLLKIGNALWVADTNNHQIRILDLKSKRVSTLMIAAAEPDLASDSPPVERLPHRVKLASPFTASAEKPWVPAIHLPENWKLNDQAPSWVTLFEKQTDGKWKSNHRWNRAQLMSSNPAQSSPLKSGRSYRAQGTLYYCPKAAGSNCFVQSIDEEFTPTAVNNESRTNVFEIDLRDSVSGKTDSATRD